jgi:regulatory protein YycI of two-component signal transduction system YycFG
MWNWFKNLGLLGKGLVIAGILVVVLFILSFVGGWSSGIKGWFYDKAYEERMAKVDTLEKENAELRAKNIEIDKKLVDSEARGAILEANDKAFTEKQKQELAKLDQLLKEQDAVEAQTAQPTDAYTRCVRTKEKMLALTPPIAAAKDINCEDKR